MTTIIMNLSKLPLTNFSILCPTHTRSNYIFQKIYTRSNILDQSLPLRSYHEYFLHTHIQPNIETNTNLHSKAPTHTLSISLHSLQVYVCILLFSFLYVFSKPLFFSTEEYFSSISFSYTFTAKKYSREQIIGAYVF